MQKIYLIQPEHITYSPKLITIELYLRYRKRDTEIIHGPQAYGEYVGINKTKINAINIIEELQEHDYQNLSIEDKFSEKYIVNLCLNQINDTLLYHMFINDQSEYIYCNPIWTISSPIKKTQFWLWLQKINYRVQRLYKRQDVLEYAFKQSIDDIANFLSKDNRTLLTQIIVYTHLQAIRICAQQENLNKIISQSPIVSNFLSKFLKIDYQLQNKIIQAEAILLKQEIGQQEQVSIQNINYKIQNQELLLKKQFKEQIIPALLGICTFFLVLRNK